MIPTFQKTLLPPSPSSWTAWSKVSPKCWYHTAALCGIKTVKISTWKSMRLGSNNLLVC